MTVPYTGLQAQIVDLAATMLADSTSFQTLVGAADAAAARAKIVEIDDTPPVGAHAAIGLPAVDLERASTDHVLGTASVDIVLLFPPTGGLTATESFRDACNTAAAIGVDLNTYDHLLVRGVAPGALVMLDESDELAGWFQQTYTIALLCMP